MLILLTILSSEARSSSKHHTLLKKGDLASEKLWCYGEKPMSYLRTSIQRCEQDRIELNHLRNLNQELIKTQPEERPIWSNWWVKLPAGFIIGGLTGILMSQSTENKETVAITSALMGTGTAVLLDFDF